MNKLISVIIPAYNNKLKNLPSHNIQIAFKSRHFAKNTPRPCAK